MSKKPDSNVRPKKRYVPPEIKEVWNEGIGVDAFYYKI